ncbi:hypothetical protein [Burkholderia sp. ABCPW 14]|uniref:hypothetical protein n=1 Tax=Burkholderia sp. ABCPW 14 TaxID=1637860 RepID=UPI000A7EF9D4|nr:hypothetical protein [Burkholderia sp. ABCPW 14]
MKSFARKVGELFALWIVIATILFIIVWLVVPQMLGTLDEVLTNPVPTSSRPA